MLAHLSPKGVLKTRLSGRVRRREQHGHQGQVESGIEWDQDLAKMRSEYWREEYLLHVRREEQQRGEAKLLVKFEAQSKQGQEQGVCCSPNHKDVCVASMKAGAGKCRPRK